MPEIPSDAAAIIDTARAGADPFKINDRIYLVPESGGRTRIVDLAPYADAPDRTVGEATVQDVDSFVEYWHKYAHPASEVWASQRDMQIVGIIDAPGAEAPGWAQHRVRLICEPDPAWQAWLTQSGQMLDQASFAELIEDRIVDFVEPAGADMLELAQTFQAKQKVAFESSKLLASGERQLTYKEDTDAKAGRRGQIDIPAEFKIGVRPFRRAEPYRVTARLRYRIREGELLLGYKLNRPDDVAQAAFDGIAQQIRDALQVPVLAGKPGYRN